MSEQLTVYISGPISKGDMQENLRHGIEVGHEVWQRGHLPFIPHLSDQLVTNHGLSYEEIMRYDLDWVARCDALLRIPGESPGADREVALAQDLGKLVFYHLDDLPPAYAAPVHQPINQEHI